MSASSGIESRLDVLEGQLRDVLQRFDAVKDRDAQMVLKAERVKMVEGASLAMTDDDVTAPSVSFAAGPSIQVSD